MAGVHLVMIPALLLAATVGTATSAVAAGTVTSAVGAGAVTSAVAPVTATSRLDAVRARYERLATAVGEPRIMAPKAREELLVRLGSAAQTIAALAADPAEPVLADLERREQLDEQVVPQLLRGTGDAPGTAPGAHVGVARAGDLPVPFAYWVPAGYDARRPGPLVVLLHGASQPESDLIARRFVRELADATGTVVLAPGGDDRDADAMVAALDAAQAAVAGAVAYDTRRRYLGGFSNGVFAAYHAVAREAQGCAGFLGIAGFLRAEDARAVGRRLYRQGAYLVIGANDEVIGAATVRSDVRVLRGQGVFARYYEVAGAPHALRPLEAAIARAWRDMLAGVTKLDDDGLGTVSDRLPG